MFALYQGRTGFRDNSQVKDGFGGAAESPKFENKKAASTMLTDFLLVSYNAKNTTFYIWFFQADRIAHHTHHGQKQCQDR